MLGPLLVLKKFSVIVDDNLIPPKNEISFWKPGFSLKMIIASCKNFIKSTCGFISEIMTVGEDTVCPMPKL